MPSDSPPSRPVRATDIVAAIAAHEDVDPLELDPVSSVVDLDAIERLFDSTTTAANDDVGYAAFRYNGYEVVVRSDGRIQVDGSYPLES